MTTRLAVSVASLLALGMFADLAAQAQEHVRLMPQLRTGVRAVALSKDGRFILTGNGESSAQLWDASIAQQIQSFTGHLGPVHSVAFSPDGLDVLTGGDDSTARLWSVVTGKQIRYFLGHTNMVASAVFSPDGRFVLTGSWDKTAFLWDAATGKQIRSFTGHTGFVTSVAFSPDGRHVLTGSWDKTARLWNAATGQQLLIFQGHSDDVNSVAFSPDGRFVLTSSGGWHRKDDKNNKDNTVRMWDAATGRQIRVFEGHSDEVDSVAFSPDGRYVLSGSYDKTVRLWDVGSGKQIRSFEGHTGPVNSVSFSSDGSKVLTGGDSTARLWETASGKQLRIFEGHTAAVGSVAFSPDGRHVHTGGADRSWDLATGQETHTANGELGHDYGVLSPDGRYWLSFTWMGKEASLWDTSTGQKLRSFIGHSNNVNAVAFSPDGQLALTGSWDKTARLWDVATGREIRTFTGHTNFVDAVAFSPDGHSVLTGSTDKTARLWDLATGKEIRSFEGHTEAILSVAFSPDGRSFLSGSYDRSARMWDIATGKQICEYRHRGGVDSVAFSPDGRFFLTSGEDETTHLWDVATGENIRNFDGHTAEVQSAAFSPDGRFVVTGSLDTTTRLWETATGKQLATLLTFDNGGWAVTDADGRYDSNDPDNTPGLIWVTNSLRPIELKQLKDDYYTPNLLASIMKGEALPDVKGLDIVPAPPEVAVALPYQSKSKHLSLVIADKGGGVGRLVVSVNERKVAVLEHPLGRRVTTKNSAAGKAEVNVDVSAATLKLGENTVKAYVFDAGNQIRSREAVAVFDVTAESRGLTAEADDALTPDYKPQFYGIIVGTSSFPGNHQIDLMYPAHDAQSMKTSLAIGAGKLFGKENVHLRLLTTDAKQETDQPKKANIVAAFAEVTKKAKPTDVLLVYLSGHGVNLRNEKDSYYYLTTDARSLEIQSNPALRELSTVSSGELKQWLGAKNMPLKEVLILDTCAAGAANEELLKLVAKRDVPPDQRRAVEFLKEATGTIILMGSAADKSSYEASKYGQGLLTYALLNGMRGRSIEDGSRLNVSHWFQNASEDVPQLAASIGGIQKPVIAAPSGTGFPVALFDPADEARVPLAAVKPELVHLSCHDGDDNDPLNLAAIVREQLRDISHPASARGVPSEPPIVYRDDMTDGPVDSLKPKVVYIVIGNTVSLRLRIEQAGKTLGEERLTLSNSDMSALANAVASRLVAMSAKIPLEHADH